MHITGLKTTLFIAPAVYIDCCIISLILPPSNWKDSSQCNQSCIILVIFPGNHFLILKIYEQVQIHREVSSPTYNLSNLILNLKHICLKVSVRKPVNLRWLNFWKEANIHLYCCFLEEGLRLFVGPGGSTSFGSHHLPNRYVASMTDPWVTLDRNASYAVVILYTYYWSFRLLYCSKVSKELACHVLNQKTKVSPKIKLICQVKALLLEVLKT